MIVRLYGSHSPSTLRWRRWSSVGQVEGISLWRASWTTRRGATSAVTSFGGFPSSASDVTVSSLFSLFCCCCCHLCVYHCVVSVWLWKYWTCFSVYIGIAISVEKYYHITAQLGLGINYSSPWLTFGWCYCYIELSILGQGLKKVSDLWWRVHYIILSMIVSTVFRCRSVSVLPACVHVHILYLLHSISHVWADENAVLIVILLLTIAVATTLLGGTVLNMCHVYYMWWCHLSLLAGEVVCMVFFFFFSCCVHNTAHVMMYVTRFILIINW